jgi:serine-protein kinase ATM
MSTRSVTPLRMKRIQDASRDAPLGTTANTSTETMPARPISPPDAIARKSDDNEPSEADRALTVVQKKLSQTLSVTATVNELIQQASDERNLAVLYCGWAAYA